MPVSGVDTTGGWRRSGGAHFLLRRKATALTAKSAKNAKTATANGDGGKRVKGERRTATADGDGQGSTARRQGAVAKVL